MKTASHHRLQLLFLSITLAILAIAIVILIWQERGQSEIAARIDTHQRVVFHSGKIRQELLQIEAQLQRRLLDDGRDGGTTARTDAALIATPFNPAISLYAIRSHVDTLAQLFEHIDIEHQLRPKLDSQLDRLATARPLLGSTDAAAIDRVTPLLHSMALTTEQLEGLHNLEQRELRRVLDAAIERDNRVLIGILLMLAVLGYFLTRWAFNLVRSTHDRFTAELEDRNAELERFVYTVSHDLRTPLVSIKGFIGFLEKDLDSNDAARIRHDMAHISQAADIMGELLDGLLELSRIGRVVNPPEGGSLTQLVAEAVESLREQIGRRGIDLEIQPDMPRYWGDRLRLIEVFQNLVENAIKFMGEQPAPRIEIRARRDGDLIRCSVSDNGIGIEPEYHDRVFDLFERLHPEIDGTGIGTTLIKRIIEAHGGTIRIESAGENRGCSFVFTLPAAPEEEPDQAPRPDRTRRRAAPPGRPDSARVDQSDTGRA